ncbi:hypothetical protein K0M31_014704, partial [Melipona bicolor]
PAHECPANPPTGSRRVARLSRGLKDASPEQSRSGLRYFSASVPEIAAILKRRCGGLCSGRWFTIPPLGSALYVAGVRSRSAAKRSNKTRDDLRSHAAASINFADG